MTTYTSREALASESIRALKQLASKNKVPRYSNLRKPALVDALAPILVVTPKPSTGETLREKHKRLLREAKANNYEGLRVVDNFTGLEYAFCRKCGADATGHEAVAQLFGNARRTKSVKGDEVYITLRVQSYCTRCRRSAKRSAK